jgi:hypothetical protein
MRIPIWLTILAALVAVVIILFVGQLLINPDRPLITSATFTPDSITPNADGSDDITTFSYGLSRNAHITLTLTDESGETYAFRHDEPRTPDDYHVLFSGVVDGFTLPGESFGTAPSEQQIIRRLIPDGNYTWRLSAVDEQGATDERTGVLRISDGSAELPEITSFTVFPTDFTPNQDGINDRTSINVFLSKAADLRVYLVGEDGAQIFIPERQTDIRVGEPGYHLFDYDGGVDMNADPPPDGTYEVVAFARDAVGQEVLRTATLTLTDGGKPFAQIIPQPTGVTVVFETRPWEDRFTSTREQPGDTIAPPDDPAALSMTTITLPVGDLLLFKLAIENYSDVPIRTTGPAPGTVYQWDQRASTLGVPDESGTWRVGIDCTTAASDYPWRWAIGSDDLLELVEDPDNGNIYRYLPAGQRAVVWGAVRMTELEARNPQNCWAGLIHEGVEVAAVNNAVGSREIRLDAP